MSAEAAVGEKDWNRLLPYAAELQQEAEEQLNDLKKGLAWSAAVQDLSGAGFYARSLDLFMDLKHKPPPDDAVRIVQTLWELVVLPNSAITVSQRSKFAMHLSDVLHKKECLRAATIPLVLPWRPVLALLRANNDAGASTPTFVGSRELSLHGKELGMLLRKSRAFFAPESVREIWTELAAAISPDEGHSSAVAILCAMLPTQHAGTHEIWLQPASTLWQSIRGKSDWDSAFLYLFARLAKHQQGVVDFSPLLPFLMDKLTAMLRLPTGGRPAGVSQTSAGRLSPYVRSRKDPFHHIGIILAFCVGPSHPEALGYVADLMRICSIYMHPSNVGQHSMTISQLLLSLVGHFARRLDRERNGRSAAPQSCWITDGDIDSFVGCVQPVTFLGVFSPHPVMGWCSKAVTRTLAGLCPSKVLSPVLERMVPLLDVAGNPHPQTLYAALDVLAMTMPSLLDLARFPAGRTYLPKILLGTVQGLDISEKQRTRATLKVYCALLSGAYLEPLSADAAYKAEECDAAISECIQPWADEFLDRALLLLDHQSKPDDQGGQDSMLLMTAARYFFAHVTPSLYEAALAKVARFVQSNLFHNALTPVGLFVEECAHAHPAQALAVFVPIIAAKLSRAKQQNEKEDSSSSASSEEEELCMLRVLSKSIKRAGPAVLEYMPFINDVLTRYIGAESRAVTKEAAKLFRCVMHGLVDIYPGPGTVVRPTPGSEDEGTQRTGYSDWCTYTDATSVTIDWHVPTEEELQAARDLCQAFVGQAIADLKRMVTEPTGYNKNSRWRILKQVHNSLRAWSVGWGEGSDGGLHSGDGDETTMYALGEEITLGAGGKNRAEQGFPSMLRKPIRAGRSALGAAVIGELHQSLGDALHGFAVYCAANLSSELDTVKVLCKAMGVWLVGSSIKGVGVKRRVRRSLDMMKIMALNPRNRMKRTRAWIIQRAAAQHQVRVLGHQPTKVFTPLCEKLMDSLLHLVVHPFSSVRKKAQSSLEMAVRRFPYRKLGIIKQMTAVLQHGLEHPEAEIKGAVYTLKSSHILPRACKEFDLLQELIRSVCAQLGHEKTSIATQVDLLFMAILSRVTFSPLRSAVCSVAIPAEWSELYVPPDAAAIAEETRHQAAAAHQERYADLVRFLEELGSGPDVHWKAALVVQTCLTFCTHVAGSAPDGKGQACGILTSSLYRSEYLGRRLGVISATVVAEMNRDLIGVERHELTIEDGNSGTGSSGDDAADAGTVSISVPVAYAAEPAGDAEAWEKTVFIDKLECGFRGPVVAGPDGSVGASRLARKTAKVGGGLSSSQLEDLGLSMLTNVDDLQRIIAHLVTDHRDEDARGSAGDVAVAAGAFIGALYRTQRSVGAGFTNSHARMWQSFFRLGGLQLFVRLLPLLTPLLATATTGGESAPGTSEPTGGSAADSSSSRRSKQAVVAEIVAGVARGSRYWPFADLEQLWTVHLLPIWERTVGSAVTEILNDWEAALSFILHRRDPRRAWWLLRWIDSCDIHLGTDTKQCVAVLRLTSAVLRTYGWRCEAFAASQMTKLTAQGLLAHPFKQVRVEVGQLLALAMTAAPAAPSCEALVSEMTCLCTVAPAAVGAGVQQASASAGADAVETESMAVDGDGTVEDGRSQEEKDRAITNARDTLLWMASLHVSRSACSPAETGSAVRRALLPLVLMAHADVDEELRSHAFSCAGSISHLQLDAAQ